MTIRKSLKTKAFTLIELLVVVFIISILAGMITVNMNSARVKSYDRQRKADLDSVQMAVEGYASKHEGKYPPTFTAGQPEEFRNSLANPTNWVPDIVPGYISVLPKDPQSSSGSPQYVYLYASDGANYKLEAMMGNDEGKKWASEDGGIDNVKYEVFTGGAVAWVRRISLEFDGLDDYVEVADSATLDVDYITLAAWVYVDEFPAGDTLNPSGQPYYYEYPIIIKSASNPPTYSQTPYFLAIWHQKAGEWEDNRLYLKMGTAAGQTISINSGVEDQVPLEKWIHIAATYNGSKMALYIDGKIVAESTLTFPYTGGPLLKSASNLYLAKPDPYWEYKYYDGKIDDARLYNSALNDAQIVEIMKRSADYLENMHLKLDEGSGNLAQDSSGNNNNGQIFGAQW